MKKVQVWTEIPDGYELTCDHDKIPEPGELAVMFNLESPDCTPIVEAVPGGMCEYDRAIRYGKCVVVRPVWKWPEWVTARFIVQTSGSGWYSTNTRPCLWTLQTTTGNVDIWTFSEPIVSLANTTFTPPKCDDWRLSLRENPHLTAEAAALYVNGLGSTEGWRRA